MSTAALHEHAKLNNGKLSAYAWPGGHTLVYYDKHGETLCAPCATKDLLDPDTEDKPTDYDVYYEGPTVYCAECNTALESSYGDPSEEDQ